MKVSLVIREGAGKNRRYVKVNKKVYPDGTVFCLRYKRKFETLNADNLTAALAARAIKEAALLTGQGSTASAQAKRIGIDDAIAVYLSNIAVTKKHKTWLAYSRATSEFRESCTKQFLDEITKDDLTAFVIAQKKKVSDRTIDNRLADLGHIPPRQQHSAEPASCVHEEKGEGVCLGRIEGAECRQHGRRTSSLAVLFGHWIP